MCPSTWSLLASHSTYTRITQIERIIILDEQILPLIPINQRWPTHQDVHQRDTRGYFLQTASIRENPCLIKKTHPAESLPDGWMQRPGRSIFRSNRAVQPIRAEVGSTRSTVPRVPRSARLAGAFPESIYAKSAWGLQYHKIKIFLGSVLRDNNQGIDPGRDSASTYGVIEKVATTGSWSDLRSGDRSSGRGGG